MYLVRSAPVALICALSLLSGCGDDGASDGTGGTGNSGNSGSGADGGGGSGTGATGTGATGTGAGGTGAGGTGAGGTGNAGGMPACTTAGDCDDSDACTTDTCDNGTCNYAAVDPDDGVACTDDSCDSVTGVANVANDANCADSNVCNGIETCDAVNDCQAGTPLVTDDGVGCTDDACDPVSGVTNTPNDANCADATVCNGIETCDAVNDCQSGTPLVVDDGVACTDDSCDPVTGVANVPNNANCTNNNVCDGIETCDAANGCMNGTPLVVDDMVGCTDDSCDPIAGVTNAPNDANCDDSDVCTGADTCDAVNDCQNPVLPVCGACNEILFDNGAGDGVSNVNASWGVDFGILDELVVDVPSAELCSLQFEVATPADLADLQVVQLDVYPMVPGDLTSLGDFATATPSVSTTYQTADGSLVITDLGATTTFQLVGINYTAPQGSYALRFSFPNNVSTSVSFPTAPPGNGTACAAAWGTGYPTPLDFCATFGPEFENIVFDVKSQLRPFRYANAVGAPILDLATLSDTLVTGAATCSVIDMEIDVNINHTWVGDVEIALTHDATGTTVQLLDDAINGLLTEDLTGTYTWSDNPAAVSFASQSGVSPIPNGLYLADDGQPMSTWAGLDVASDWTLDVTDDEAGIEGTLNSWGIFGVCQP